MSSPIRKLAVLLLRFNANEFVSPILQQAAVGGEGGEGGAGMPGGVPSASTAAPPAGMPDEASPIEE